ELARHAGTTLSGVRMFVACLTAATLALLGLAAADLTGAGTTAEQLPDGKALDDLPLLARALFSRYVLPFEAASLLLLATMVGVIVLAKRQRGEKPSQRANASGTDGAPSAAPRETG